MISYSGSAVGFDFGQHPKTPVGSFDNDNGVEDCHDVPTIKMGHKRKSVETFVGSVDSSRAHKKDMMMSHEDNSLVGFGLDLMLPILEEATSSSTTSATNTFDPFFQEAQPIGLQTPVNQHYHQQGPSKRQQRSPLLERYVPSAKYAHFCLNSLPMQVRSSQATIDGIADHEEEEIQIHNHDSIFKVGGGEESPFPSLLSTHRSSHRQQYHPHEQHEQHEHHSYGGGDDDEDTLPDSLWVPDMMCLDEEGGEEEASQSSSSSASILPVLRLQPKHPCDDLYWQTTRRTMPKKNNDNSLISYSINGDEDANDDDDAPGPIKSMF